MSEENTKVRLQTEVRFDELNGLFDQFKRIVGEKNWHKRIKSVQADIKGHPYLKEYLLRENEIAYSLCDFSVNFYAGNPIIEDIRSSRHYETGSFMMSLLNVYKLTATSEKKALIGRVRGALRNPDDLRGLQFEWLIAIHLSRRGFEVRFPKQNHSSNYDLLAVKDGTATEIECKSISSDKGRQVHARDALEFHSIVLRDIGDIVKKVKGGLMVRIVVSGRFPARHVDRKRIAEAVKKALFSNSTITEAEFEIQLHEFDFANSPFSHKRRCTGEEIQQFAEERFGIVNREVMASVQPGQGAFLIALDSQVEDRVLKYTFQVVSKACEKQLSGEHAGIICVKLEGLNASQLVSLEGENGSPSALRRYASDFLSTRTESHLVGLAFFSSGDIRYSDGAFSGSGRSYFFDNKTSPLHNDVSISALRDLDHH